MKKKLGNRFVKM